MHHMCLLNVLKKFAGLLTVNVTDKPVEVETCLPNASIPGGDVYYSRYHYSQDEDHRRRRLGLPVREKAKGPHLLEGSLLYSTEREVQLADDE